MYTLRFAGRVKESINEERYINVETGMRKRVYLRRDSIALGPGGWKVFNGNSLNVTDARQPINSLSLHQAFGG